MPLFGLKVRWITKPGIGHTYGLRIVEDSVDNELQGIWIQDVMDYGGVQRSVYLDTYSDEIKRLREIAVEALSAGTIRRRERAGQEKLEISVSMQSGDKTGLIVEEEFSKGDLVSFTVIERYCEDEECTDIDYVRFGTVPSHNAVKRLSDVLKKYD